MLDKSMTPAAVEAAVSRKKFDMGQEEFQAYRRGVDFVYAMFLGAARLIPTDYLKDAWLKRNRELRGRSREDCFIGGMEEGYKFAEGHILARDQVLDELLTWLRCVETDLTTKNMGDFKMKTKTIVDKYLPPLEQAHQDTKKVIL